MNTRQWQNITNYMDTVGTTLKTFSFNKTQNLVKVTIRGNANVTYAIGSQSGTLTPGQSITVSEKITSFNLTAVSGVQTVEVWSTEDGTQKIEDDTPDVKYDEVFAMASRGQDITHISSNFIRSDGVYSSGGANAEYGYMAVNGGETLYISGTCKYVVSQVSGQSVNWIPLAVFLDVNGIVISSIDGTADTVNFTTVVDLQVSVPLNARKIIVNGYNNGGTIQQDVVIKEKSFVSSSASAMAEIPLKLENRQFYINGTLPKTAITYDGYASYSQPVMPGEVYRLITSTYNSNNYGYSLYNSSTLYGTYLQGTASARTDIDTYITIPPGVDTLLFTACTNYGSVNNTRTPHLYKLIKVDIVSNQQNKKVNGLKFACLGDSITSDEVIGTGTQINELLGTTLIGNFAHGNAKLSDWYSGTTNNTPITFNIGTNSDTAENVLSNQVRTLLRHTTALGAQITWNHLIDGSFSIDTAVGTGLGYTSDIPDIIYIAIGINDNPTSTPVVDDSATIFSQTYSQLTRCGMASSLRWAIETLQSAYPDTDIFVASPMQVALRTSQTATHNSFVNLQTKRDIIKKVCEFCAVHFIDSFAESGTSQMLAGRSLADGTHPSKKMEYVNAQFVTNNINNRFVKRTLTGKWFDLT